MGHGDGAHYFHLARRQRLAKIRRQVRRHHTAAFEQEPAKRKPNAPPAARKVHESGALRVVRRDATEGTGTRDHPYHCTRQIRRAAVAIAELGPRYVVVKGGHRRDAPIDIVFDGIDYVNLPADRIETTNTHGTGCTFSAAIAAYLARGDAPLQAIVAAKAFISEALRTSYRIGNGHSPVNHFHAVCVAEPSLVGQAVAEEER